LFDLYNKSISYYIIPSVLRNKGNDVDDLSESSCFYDALFVLQLMSVNVMVTTLTRCQSTGGSLCCRPLWRNSRLTADKHLSLSSMYCILQARFVAVWVSLLLKRLFRLPCLLD